MVGVFLVNIFTYFFMEILFINFFPSFINHWASLDRGGVLASRALGISYA